LEAGKDLERSSNRDEGPSGGCRSLQLGKSQRAVKDLPYLGLGVSSTEAA
jgi:hypothetical protein